MEEQYLIVMFHMFSMLVIITLCIPMMLGVFSLTSAIVGYLELSCQSKEFHLGTSI